MCEDELFHDILLLGFFSINTIGTGCFNDNYLILILLDTVHLTQFKRKKYAVLLNT